VAFRSSSGGERLREPRDDPLDVVEDAEQRRASARESDFDVERDERAAPTPIVNVLPANSVSVT